MHKHYIDRRGNSIREANICNENKNERFEGSEFTAVFLSQSRVKVGKYFKIHTLSYLRLYRRFSLNLQRLGFPSHLCHVELSLVLP